MTAPSGHEQRDAQKAKLILPPNKIKKTTSKQTIIIMHSVSLELGTQNKTKND